MSMDQIEGLEPIHENWGDVDLGESDQTAPIEARYVLLPCLPLNPAAFTLLPPYLPHDVIYPHV